MSEHDLPTDERLRRVLHAWVRRFGHALRGVIVAFVKETNFTIFAIVAAIVSAAGAWVGLSTERWCLIALCMAFVTVAEMVNTAIEHLARAITREQHPEIRDSLDIASGAVLLAAIGSAIVGLVLVGAPLVSALF